MAVAKRRLPVWATEIPYIFEGRLHPALAVLLRAAIRASRPPILMHTALSSLAFALPGFLGQLQGIPLLLLMFVVMYFLLIAPNQKKQKTWQAMLSQLKAGDRVTTNGGLRGTIVSVKDDVLVIRVAPDNVKLEFVKSAIAAVTTEDTKA